MESAPKKIKKRGFFRRLFNVKRWISYDQIVDIGQSIRNQSREVFKADTKATRIETFDEAVQRLSLTPGDVVNRTKQFLWMAYVYLGVALVVFIYAIYSLVVSNFTTMLVSLILAIFVLTQALREHFWYMQMTQRRLGCTFGDWRKFMFTALISKFHGAGK